jgi:hypothetical protein
MFGSIIGWVISIAAEVLFFPPPFEILAHDRQVYMADMRQFFYMATSRKKKSDEKTRRRSEKDEILESVEMYKMWLARKPIEEICDKFAEDHGGEKISERTAQRRIATGKAIVEAAQAIAPRGYTKIKNPDPDISNEKERKPVDPGAVSRGIMVRGPSNHGSIAMPKQNPLAGISDIADMGKIGVHTGVILGGAAHDIQEAFTRTDLPLDQRMLTLTRGSSVAANAVLGIVEMLRVLNDPLERPLKDVTNGEDQ